MIILHQIWGIKRNDEQFGKENRDFGWGSYKFKDIGSSSHGIKGEFGQQSRIWRDKTPMEPHVPSTIHHFEGRIHKPKSPLVTKLIISIFQGGVRM